MFLDAFFLIVPHILSQICHYDQKPSFFFFFPSFARFCTPKRCTHVHCLVLKNNPTYVIFFVLFCFCFCLRGWYPTSNTSGLLGKHPIFVHFVAKVDLLADWGEGGVCRYPTPGYGPAFKIWRKNFKTRGSILGVEKKNKMGKGNYRRKREEEKEKERGKEEKKKKGRGKKWGGGERKGNGKERDEKMKRWKWGSQGRERMVKKNGSKRRSGRQIVFINRYFPQTEMHTFQLFFHSKTSQVGTLIQVHFTS